LKNINRDITYLIGTNAQDNFDVIDSSDPDDIWFHVKDLPSCHVIALIHDLNINRKDLLYIVTQGALLCKQNSKYKSDKNVKIMYTRIKNVETLETPGSVITTDTKVVTI
jgi:predicted ribosome quality control (RQC) complex YloA/Tae2 family protein